MLLFRERGVAYVHVPKTSGTKLRKFLSSEVGVRESWWGVAKAPSGSPEGLRFDRTDRAHWTAAMIREFRPALWGKMLGMRVFSVARDPFRRAVSAYGQFLRNFGEGAAGVRCLSEYIRRIGDGAHMSRRDGYLYIHGAPQVEFHLPNHRVISGEDLSGELSTLFGVDLRFVSSERPVRGLSESERSLVESVYKEDILLWRSLGGRVSVSL